MNTKLIGAILILTGCGGFGFSMAAYYRLQERSLRQLARALEYMSCELSFRLTPLPRLCADASQIADGCVSDLFMRLSAELDRQISPDAVCCMDQAMKQTPDIPDITAEILTELGLTLGCFDLPGQLRGLENCQRMTKNAMDSLSVNRDQRLRSYQTLGLCAGAALVIIFL